MTMICFYVRLYHDIVDTQVRFFMKLLNNRLKVSKTLMFSLERIFLIISKLVFWSKIRQEQNIENFSILKSLIDHLFAVMRFLPNLKALIFKWFLIYSLKGQYGSTLETKPTFKLFMILSSAKEVFFRNGGVITVFISSLNGKWPLKRQLALESETELSFKCRSGVTFNIYKLFKVKANRTDRKVQIGVRNYILLLISSFVVCWLPYHLKRIILRVIYTASLSFSMRFNKRKVYESRVMIANFFERLN